MSLKSLKAPEIKENVEKLDRIYQKCAADSVEFSKTMITLAKNQPKALGDYLNKEIGLRVYYDSHGQISSWYEPGAIFIEKDPGLKTYISILSHKREEECKYPSR